MRALILKLEPAGLGFLAVAYGDVQIAPGCEPGCGCRSEAHYVMATFDRRDVERRVEPAVRDLDIADWIPIESRIDLVRLLQIFYEQAKPYCGGFARGMCGGEVVANDDVNSRRFARLEFERIARSERRRLLKGLMWHGHRADSADAGEVILVER